MQEIILKENINEEKIKALLNFLKSIDVEAEFITHTKEIKKVQQKISLSVGIWNDYDIDAKTLRKNAWHRKL